MSTKIWFYLDNIHYKKYNFGDKGKFLMVEERE